MSAIGPRVLYRTNFHVSDGTSVSYRTSWQLGKRSPLMLLHKLPSQILKVQTLCYVQSLDVKSAQLCRCEPSAMLPNSMRGFHVPFLQQHYTPQCGGVLRKDNF